MEWQYLSLILTVALGVVSFLMKRSITENDNKIRDLQLQQHDLSKELQITKQTYLHKDDFKEFKQELRGMFEEIRSDIRSLQK